MKHEWQFMVANYKIVEFITKMQHLIEKFKIFTYHIISLFLFP